MMKLTSVKQEEGSPGLPPRINEAVRRGLFDGSATSELPQ